MEKFLMMYTCKLCSGRNAQMVGFFVCPSLYILIFFSSFVFRYQR
jgi:hypothetical protein